MEIQVPPWTFLWKLFEVSLENFPMFLWVFLLGFFLSFLANVSQDFLGFFLVSLKIVPSFLGNTNPRSLKPFVQFLMPYFSYIARIPLLGSLQCFLICILWTALWHYITKLWPTRFVLQIKKNLNPQTKKTRNDTNFAPTNCPLQKDEEDLDPEDIEDEQYTLETRSKCKPSGHGSPVCFPVYVCVYVPCSAFVYFFVPFTLW